MARMNNVRAAVENRHEVEEDLSAAATLPSRARRMVYWRQRLLELHVASLEPLSLSLFISLSFSFIVSLSPSFV